MILQRPGLCQFCLCWTMGNAATQEECQNIICHRGGTSIREFCLFPPSTFLWGLKHTYLWKPNGVSSLTQCFWVILEADFMKKVTWWLDLKKGWKHKKNVMAKLDSSFWKIQTTQENLMWWILISAERVVLVQVNNTRGRTASLLWAWVRSWARCHLLSEGQRAWTEKRSSRFCSLHECQVPGLACADSAEKRKDFEQR